MAVVQLGEDVRSVRWKIGMEANEYLSPWRLINVRVSEVFHIAKLIPVDQRAGDLPEKIRQYASKAS